MFRAAVSVAVVPFSTPGLAAEIQQPLQADAALYWLGQAGFLIRGAGPFRPVVLIDPYLSDALAEKYRGRLFAHTRLMPPPLAASDPHRIDLVLCSHQHGDHMDIGTLPTLAERHPKARFVCPEPVRSRMLDCGVTADQLQTLGGQAAEGPLDVAGVRIRAVPSAHEELQFDSLGNSFFLGYIIEVGGVRIYHSGDCAPYDWLAGRLRELSIDFALLPVNGRDAHRMTNGVPGNFTLDEAVQLCLDAGIPTLLAHHIGMFEFNTLPLSDVRAKAAQLEDDGTALAVLSPELSVRYEIHA